MKNISRFFVAQQKNSNSPRLLLLGRISLVEGLGRTMRKIAILNFKGGTGKTTTAINFSHALALEGQNVLVVDCDPQGSVADWLGINPKNTFFDLLSDTVRLEECIYQT